MRTVQQKLEDFKTLSLEDKKDIVVVMLSKLKTVNESFAYVYDTLNKMSLVKEELLVSIYKEIIELADKKRQANKDIELSSYENMKQYLDNIKIQEEQEREEEDVDSLLDNI